MPYKIVPSGRGYVVESMDSGKILSTHPLSKKKAQKQRIAVALSEHRKHPEVPVKKYFV
jgi:hypothetical protein